MRRQYASVDVDVDELQVALAEIAAMCPRQPGTVAVDDLRLRAVVSYDHRHGWPRVLVAGGEWVALEDVVAVAVVGRDHRRRLHVWVRCRVVFAAGGAG